MKKVLIIILTIGLMLSSAFSQEKSPLKIMGAYFGDYFYNVGRDTASSGFKNSTQSGIKDANGFSIRRLQLAFNYEFSDKIVTKLRIESDGAVLNSTNNSFGLFIKDAFVQFNDVLPGMNILTGMIPTMGAEISEGLWGYRSVERIPIDLRKFLGTRDLGVAVRGRFDKEGNFGYGLMLGNNSGTVPETDRNKRFYGTVTAKPIKELSLALSGDYAWKNADQNTSTFLFDAAYNQKDVFSVGIDGFYVTQANSMLNSGTLKLTDPINSLGFSIYANVFFMPELALVLRLDNFDPNTNSVSTGDSRNYIIAGLAYSPIKNVRIIPNVQYEMYETGKWPNGSDRKYDASITARVTFEFKFEK